MGNKNQFPPVINWQSTTPVTGLLPVNTNNYGGGTKPSGTIAGTMSGTNTIYTNVLEVSRFDNHGLEVTWTGTPTGTITVLCSNSGINFYPLTFNPALTQPAGSAGGYLINLNQVPFKYLMLQYVNSTGSGTLSVYGQLKDVN